MHNWQKKNTPWLCRYEELCRSNSFVTYENRDAFVPSSPLYYQPEMPKQDEQQQQHDLRSYDPYLISYHEDTHSFTYNDPWVEVTHEDINNSHFNDNVVEHHQDFTSTPSLPATTTSSNTNESNNLEISTSSSTHHDEDSNYNNYSEKLITQNHQPPPPAVIEKVVEHKTEEVSCLSLSPSSFRVQK